MRKPQSRKSVVVALPARWKVAVWMRLKDPDLFESLMKNLALNNLRLAQSVGKSHTTIANIRRGESCRPDTAHAIAGVLGIEWHRLFELNVSRTPRQENSTASRRRAA